MKVLAPALALVLAASGVLSAQQQPAGGGAPAVPNPSKMDVLRDLSTSFEEISQRSGKAVVQIFVRSYTPNDNTSVGGDVLTAQNSSGSGIIMTSDGYILTNAHVVKNPHSIKVQLNLRGEQAMRDGGDRALNRPMSARLVGVDHDSDLAVIKVERQNLPFLMFGDSDALKQGQLVLALGNPLGLDNSVSFGVVSAVARQIKPDDPLGYIQTDAPINPGNSGGPLVDTEGHVVGINTLIYTQSGGSEGIGFAIPSNLAQVVYKQLKEQGHVHRAQLGVVGETVSPELAENLNLEVSRGVIVSDVASGGPADHGGLQADDIILEMNDRPIRTMHELESSVFRLRPGAKVSLKVQRGSNQMDIPITAEERPSEALDALADLVDPLKNLVPQLGIVGLDINQDVLKLVPDLRRPAGVVVAARKTITPYTGNLQVGDAIYTVNRRVISNVSQLRDALGTFKSGDSVALLVEREGSLRYISLELE